MEHSTLRSGQGATRQWTAEQAAHEAHARRAPTFFQLVHDRDRGSLHEKLYRRVRELILSGKLSHGARLASSRDLAASLGVSRNSVLTAIDRLIADGFLEARKGSGVYVTYCGAHNELRGLSADAAPQRPEGMLPFALGLTSVDLFPVRTWQRLQSRRWKGIASPALLEGEPCGWIGLREAIAAHSVMTRGLQCTPDRIFVTSSIPATVDLAVRAAGLVGKTVWMEDPGYDAGARALRYGGAQPIAVSVDEWGIDVEKGRRLAPFAGAAFVTPAYQFPTGCLMSNARRNALLEWARETGSWILEDDFGSHSAREPAPPPLAAEADSRTIYINSFNHMLFPSLRIAYLIVPETLVERFSEFQKSAGASSNIPNQMVLADFITLGHLDEHIERLRVSREQRYAALRQALETHLSQYLTPRGNASGSHIICSLKQHNVPSLLAECRSQNIVVEPMSKYRLDGEASNDVVLGSHSFPPKTIADAAVKLREVFAAIDLASTF